jgi:PAP2 superfamily
LRPGEAISLVAFLCFMLLGWLRRLDRSRQYQIIGLGMLGVVIVVILQAASIRFPQTSRVFGDWLPAALILIAYWQSGRFYRAPNLKLQAWLEDFDRQRVGVLLSRWEEHGSCTWVGAYFEGAYLFCYVLIPLGVATLYFFHRRAVVDLYWSAVLSATYLCYLVIPFAASLPPRFVQQCPSRSKLSKVHSFNVFILRNASIQINTFPSAHVASTMAGAFVLLQVVPVVGTVFLLIALSIAAGAVLGRYHYTPDVVLGGLLAAAVARLILR